MSPVSAHPVQPALPALMVGGGGSHNGKTVTTLALLCALRARGLRVHAAKAGPDYIDTAFHAALSNGPTANLDIWMCRTARIEPGQKRKPSPLRHLPPPLARLVRRMSAPGHDDLAPDMLLAEGAMGLYDGGSGGEGCTAQLAALLGWPVLLVLDAKGMGQSAAAVAEGFLRHRPAWLRPGQAVRFAGVICTHVGSSRHAAILREAFSRVTTESRVPLLGLLPRDGAPHIPSRHLGLKEAREVVPGLDTADLACWLEAHCDVAALLRRLGLPEQKAVPPSPESGRGAVASCPSSFFRPYRRRSPRVRIAMAWDAAFSFCYADLPALLHELGAETVVFSPLADAAPPPCHALYFPGGYPELHAAALAANTSMLAALRALAEDGLPVYGECGGYIYLMRGIEMEGRVYPMSGLLPLSCRLGQHRAALGYRQALALPGWPPSADRRPGQRPLLLRGHEFHYAALTETQLPPHCTALWCLRDSQGADMGPEGCRCGSVAGSWLHLYPAGARRFWKAWLAALPERKTCP